MSSWFNSLGWWDQHEAYKAFDAYRKDPTDEKLNAAIMACLPVIRVVSKTQQIFKHSEADQEDMISAAAITIVTALPKMRDKTEEQIGNDKQLMRYLFSCVVNSFRRELGVLYYKQQQIIERATERRRDTLEDEVEHDPLWVRKVDFSEIAHNFNEVLFSEAMKGSKHAGVMNNITSYFLQVFIYDRETSSRILSICPLSREQIQYLSDYARFMLRKSLLRLKQLIFI